MSLSRVDEAEFLGHVMFSRWGMGFIAPSAEEKKREKRPKKDHKYCLSSRDYIRPVLIVSKI